MIERMRYRRLPLPEPEPDPLRGWYAVIAIVGVVAGLLLLAAALSVGGVVDWWMLLGE